MDKLPKIIGITGRKFTGKDTLGNYLVDTYGYTRLAYADALKDAVKAIFDFDDEQLYGNKKEDIDEYWGITPRQVLQFVGTDLFRNHICELLPTMGKDIWINVIKRKISNMTKRNQDAKFVITDIRFPNELQAIKDLYGTTIKIQRNDAHEKVNKQNAITNMQEIGSKLSILTDISPQDLAQYTKILEQITAKLQITNASKDLHESEALIDTLSTDITIDNNGTKKELFDTFDTIMNIA
ncbi:monophosphate kinase [Bodo saltans virus]|uniref:Monophosphate kinase n=1 Tax=Bodo saltans virus TaxID=2024608 RepID=A0A2H4UVJ0_9VIRU|nr:monophosphate kinase [Bodo saltans virus]ATZ80931.1 monophosphate kinase [Bodo saltans virus]